MEPKLRVLTVLSFPWWAGTEAYAVELSRGLADRGHDVGFAHRPGTPIERALAGSRVQSCPVAPHRPNDFWGMLRLWRLLRGSRYQVVNAHGSKDYRPTLLAARLARCPVIFTRLEMDTLRPRKARLMAGSDRVIAVSNAVRSLLVDHDGVPADLVTTIHIGLDTQAILPRQGPRKILPELGLPAEGPVFGMASRLTEWKRCDVFLRAAAILKRSHPGVRYVLVGDGEERAPLEALAAELGLQQHVVFAGFRKDARQIIGELTSLVLPSRKEPFALVMLEAMCSAVPVIGSDSGGTPEAVLDGETGLLFPLDDAEALAAAMQTFADDPQRAHSTGLAARRRAETEFSREIMLDRVEAAYRDVVRNA